MKVLYYGGQKSGKSYLAEQKSLELSQNKKPYYIATYDNSYGDTEMQKRILKHQKQREEMFITIEESMDLTRHIKAQNTYLVDCVSMWLLNNIDKPEDRLLEQIDSLKEVEANIVFVLNSVNEGVIPMDRVSRRFVDLTGIIGQRLALICDEVYEVKLGLSKRLK